MMTWLGARKGDAKLTGGGQDYVLVYARNREFLRANDVKWRERKEGLEPVYAKVRELQALHGDDFDAATAEPHRLLIHLQSPGNLRERQTRLIQSCSLPDHIGLKPLATHNHALASENAENRGLCHGVLRCQRRRGLTRFVAGDNLSPSVMAETSPRSPSP